MAHSTTEHFCHCGELAVKRCSGCSNKWYCSRDCRKYGWFLHIFECSNPGREINTADRLMLACMHDQIPSDPQTLSDYGFVRAKTSDDQGKLLSLYIGLLKIGEVNPMKLHKWRVSGTIGQEIKNFYNKIPEDHRGAYFPWFLENQQILDPSLPAADENLKEDTLKQTWRFIGGEASLSMDQISNVMKSWPDERRACFDLFQVLLNHWTPKPSQDAWVLFGFCACVQNEELLGDVYEDLVVWTEEIKFDDFCTTFASTALLPLFESKGLLKRYSILSPELEDVLCSSPTTIKSVWYLKAFTLTDDLEPRYGSVSVDYGFSNCQTAVEKAALKKLYAAVLNMKDARPLLLHVAAKEGQLFKYVASLFPLSRQYEELMKNPNTQ